MNTNEESRKAMAENRLHQEHLNRNVLHRSQAEVRQPSTKQLESEARELMVEQRKKEEHLHENMLCRTEAEIDFEEC